MSHIVLPSFRWVGIQFVEASKRKQLCGGGGYTISIGCYVWRACWGYSSEGFKTPLNVIVAKHICFKNIL